VIWVRYNLSGKGDEGAVATGLSYLLRMHWTNSGEGLSRRGGKKNPIAQKKGSSSAGTFKGAWSEVPDSNYSEQEAVKKHAVVDGSLRENYYGTFRSIQ